MTRLKLKPSQKQYIWIRDKCICKYCGLRMTGNLQRLLTVDHVIARINGGTNDESNLVTACRPCNNKKSFRERPLRIYKHETD